MVCCQSKSKSDDKTPLRENPPTTVPPDAFLPQIQKTVEKRTSRFGGLPRVASQRDEKPRQNQQVQLASPKEEDIFAEAQKQRGSAYGSTGASPPPPSMGTPGAPKPPNRKAFKPKKKFGGIGGGQKKKFGGIGGGPIGGKKKGRTAPAPGRNFPKARPDQVVRNDPSIGALRPGRETVAEMGVDLRPTGDAARILAALNEEESEESYDSPKGRQLHHL